MTGQKLSPEQFDFLLNHYLEKPEDFVTEVLGAQLWSMQIEIIKSVFQNKITAVKTCNAVGKSFVAARIVVTYLMLYPNSVVVTTAPTWDQVTDVLWREIASAIKLSRYKLTDVEVRQAGLSLGETWYAVGRSPRKKENFFGYHADHLLVVVDEAGGVEEPIFEGVTAITPNVNSRVLLIGNPTNPSGTFFNYFDKPDLGAKCFTISAFDSPNFTDIGITNIEDLIAMYKPRNDIPQVEWTKRINEALEKRLNPDFTALIHPGTVYGRYYEYGPDSAAWQALIMGEFPTQAAQQLIPTDLVTMSMHMRGIDEDTGETYAELSGWKVEDGAKEYGLDMARYGDDSTVLTPRHGGWIEDQIVWNKTDLMTSAKKVVEILGNEVMDPDIRVNIDDTGNGGGTTDRLQEIGGIDQKLKGRPTHQYAVVPFNFSAKDKMRNPQKFHDITSELYWNMRSWFFDHAIALPNDVQLRDELIARRWSILPNGKIKVESKDEYKKRTGGKSPDRSDSLALSLAGGYRKITRPKDKNYRSPELEKRTPFTSGLNNSRLNQRSW